MISDLEVTGLVDRYKTASPADQLKIRADLAEWRKAKDQEARDAQENHFQSLFTNPEYLRQQQSDPALHQAEKLNPSPEPIIIGASNRAFLSFREGRDISGTEYPVLRDAYAQKVTGKKTVSDGEFFDIVKGEYETKIAREGAVRDLQMKATAQALQDALDGRQTKLAPAFRQWADANRKLIDDKNESPFLTEAFKSYRGTLADIEKYREPAADVWNTLTAVTQGKAGDQDVARLGERIATMPRDARQKVFAYAAIAAEANGVDRGAFAQVAKNLGESVSRSFGFVGNFELNGQEAAIRQMAAYLRDPGSEVKSKILGDYATQQLASSDRGKKALAGELSASDSEAFAKELESKLPVLQAVRELNDLAKNRIDPIKMVAKPGTFLGAVEQGAYGLAGSTGYLAATAVPGAGLMLGFAAYQSDEYNRLLVENPDMDHSAAWALSSVEAAGNALIDKVQLDRIPALAGLAQHVQVNGWRKTLATGGKIWAEQTAQELAQNGIAPVLETIAASMRTDMTPKNAGEELDKYIRDIPATMAATGWLALIGAGFASVADFKNPTQEIDSALKFWGFSEEQAARIKAATTPEQFDTAIREEMAKRTPENIAAGRKQANEVGGKVEQDQNDPSKPTMEAITKADGSRVWRVTGADGNLDFETADQTAAEQAYIDAARQAEFDRLTADKQAAQSDEGQLGAGKQAGEIALFGENGGATDGTNGASGDNSRSGLQTRPGIDLEGSGSGIGPARGEASRVADAFRSLGFEIHAGPTTRAGIARGDRLVLQYDGTDIVGREGQAIKAGVEPGMHTRAIFGEELIHAADYAATKRQWEAAGKPGAFSEYFDAKHKAVFDDIRGTIDAAPDALKEQLSKAVQASYHLYFSELSQPVKSGADWRGILSEIEGQGLQVKFVGEFIRQLVQMKRQGGINEEVQANVLDRLIQQLAAWVRGAIAEIKRAVPGAFRGDFGQETKTMLERIEKELDGIPGKPPEQLSNINPPEDVTGFEARKLDPALHDKMVADALEKHMKSPDGRIGLFERAREKLMALRDENQVAIEGMKWSNAGAEKVSRERLIRSIGELDALLSVFPPEIRGKVGGFAVLSKIGNGEKALADFFTKRVEMIGTELERSLKREYGSKMAKLMERSKPAKNQSGQKREGKAGADLHALFDTLRDAMDWTIDRAEAHVTALEAQIAKGEMTPEEEAHAQMEIGLVPLVASWKQADAERRAAAVASATEIWDRGYRAFKEQKIQERERRQAIRQQLITDTGKAGTAPERDAKALENNSLKGRWKDSLLGLLNFEQVSKWVFGDKSIEAQRLADMEREASHAKEDSITEKTVALEDLFTKLAGDRFKGERLRWQMAQKSITAPLTNGKESLHMSQLEAITATLLWRQEDGRRHMIGLLDDSGKPVSAWHYNQDFIDNIEKQLTPEAREVRAFLSEQYAGEYARLNPVYRELNGINLPKNANYSPITVVPQQAQAGQTIDPVTGNTMSTASTTPGSLRTRSGRVAEPDFRDALQVYISHTKQMEHWIAYAKFVNEATALLNNRDVGNSVQAASGEQAVKVLRGWLDYFGKGGTRDAGAFLALNQGLGRMMNRAASVALVGRIGTIAVQSTQLAAGLAEMQTGSYLSRLGKLFTGQLDWKAAFNSDYIQRRLKEMPPVVRQAVEGIQAEKPNRLRYAVSKLGQLIGGTDALMTAGTYAIVHDYQLKRAHESGLTGADAERAAREAAERSVDRIAQPTRPGARSLFENTATNPAVRLAWAFASDARKNFGLMAYALANRPAAEAARVITAVWIANSVMAAIIRSAWADARNDDDEEIFDAKNWSPKTLALKAATDPLAGIPFLGDKAQGMVLRAFGVWTPEGDILSGLDRATGSVRRIDDYLAGDFEAKDVFRDVDAILSGMGLLNSNIAAAASLSHLAKDLFGVTENAAGK
ncbi:hypothetical protein TSACC_3694 [Terrimicrobium sacchariphilum]|uniref:Large polyvalent protein associated domain-containing protein n=1 Tax=Terrimicrobium sacchariphilum TaxID=690879 RepID=A0A146GEU6_TERSA|nr:hypothetical protein [Terrimicrobium sacchariphilum]GAT35623.1 hypothetical protein TSACC_3694 [Terrimicrobium sacchariphilum]